MIWDEVLLAYYTESYSSERSICVDYDEPESALRPSFQPEICTLSHRLRAGTCYILVRDHQFLLYSNVAETSFRAFLKSFPGGFKAVRKFDLGPFLPYKVCHASTMSDLTDKFQIPPRLDLAVNYPGLSSLTLSFACSLDFGHCGNDENEFLRVFFAQSTEEIVQKYGFEKLLLCDNLREIRLVHECKVEEWMGIEKCPFVEEVAEWIRDEFTRTYPGREMLIHDCSHRTLKRMMEKVLLQFDIYLWQGLEGCVDMPQQSDH